MRDVIEVGTDERLRLTAFQYGWARAGDQFMAEGRGPFVAWVSKQGLGSYVMAEPSCVAQPLRAKLICRARHHMAGRCPCCDGGSERLEDATIVYLHADGCPIRDDAILTALEATQN